MSSDEAQWRKAITHRLRERNKKETSIFSEIIIYSKNITKFFSLLFLFWTFDCDFVLFKTFLFSLPDNRLVDTTVQLRSENLKLSVENEKLQSGILPTYGSGGSGNENNSSKIQALEKKLMAQQEELTSLHKRKGENSQMIVDLNLKVTEQMKSITEKDNWYELLLIEARIEGICFNDFFHFQFGWTINDYKLPESWSFNVHNEYWRTQRNQYDA